MHRENLQSRIRTTTSSPSPSRSGRNAVARAVEQALEPLESRRLYAVTAMSSGGVLTVFGDAGDNAITISRNAAGALRVNNGAVAVQGATATVTTIGRIVVSGLGGNDKLALDETNGALPQAALFGGDGNDTLTGGSAADNLHGDAGNDMLFGMADNDTLFGGAGNDTLTGGAGTDQARGETGNDQMIWNPGDGSDVNEGGDGIDTVIVNGGDVGETFTAAANGTRVRFARVSPTGSPAPFSLDIGTTENLTLNANGGNDMFSGGTGLASLMKFTINGGAGDDALNGTDGNDTLNGGDGNDLIDGNGGADVANLGAGNDAFRWDPGDGSDVIEGGTGADTMVFFGAKADETVDLSANGSRLRFFRNPGNITMDTHGVETVDFDALGGADNVTVHNLAGTGVTAVNVDLKGTLGFGDGERQNVVVEGTTGNDFVTVSGNPVRGVAVNGLSAQVNITNADPFDKLSVNTLGGNDVVNAFGMDANVMLFAADGGTGNDVLVGGAGNDTLLGNDGQDVLIGAGGLDSLFGGNGDDVLVQ